MPGHKYIPKRFYPKTENCSSAQPLRATPNCMHPIHPTDQKFGEFTVGQKIWSSPALGLDGSVYFGCHNGKNLCTKPRRRILIWTHNAQSAVAGPVTLGYDDTLFAITSSGKL